MTAGTSYFAVRLVHGPAWDAARGIREQAGWTEHAAFMDRLVASGFILHGGPVGDRTATLHLVAAADEHAVRACLAADPWAEAEVLAVGTIEAWELWLDARHHES